MHYCLQFKIQFQTACVNVYKPTIEYCRKNNLVAMQMNFEPSSHLLEVLRKWEVPKFFRTRMRTVSTTYVSYACMQLHVRNCVTKRVCALVFAIFRPFCVNIIVYSRIEIKIRNTKWVLIRRYLKRNNFILQFSSYQTSEHLQHQIHRKT